MPKQSSADAAMCSVKDLIYALKHPQPATPFDIGNKQLKALKTLANIFSKVLQELLVLPTDTTKPSTALRVEPEKEPTELFSVPAEPTKNYNADSNQQCHPYNSSQAHANAISLSLNLPNRGFPLTNSVIHPVTGKAIS
jgi:hypothetical protein